MAINNNINNIPGNYCYPAQGRTVESSPSIYKNTGPGSIYSLTPNIVPRQISLNGYLPGDTGIYSLGPNIIPGQVALNGYVPGNTGIYSLGPNIVPQEVTGNNHVAFNSLGQLYGQNPPAGLTPKQLAGIQPINYKGLGSNILPQ